MDVYSIGEMVIDFTPGSEPASYIRNAGGAPVNAAIAVVKSGLTAGVCCSVGDDDFGHFLMDTLREYQVRILNPRLCREAVTTMAFVTLSDSGDRSFVFARKPGADMFLREEDVREEDIRESAIVHAGSCSLSASPAREATARALRLGREMGKLVSFDVNYRNLMWDDDQDACAQAVREILPYVDLLKISEEEVEMMGGEAHIPALMEEFGLTVVMETLGGDGARCFFKGGNFLSSPVKGKCIDATAAGDAFWGGFLASLRLQGVSAAGEITGDILRRAAAYGNASGGLCVQRKGAIAAIPTREEIEAQLGA